MQRYNDTLEQGNGGMTVIDDTSATTGKFGGILVVDDAVISAITDAKGVTNSAGLVGITLPAGLYIPIPFDSITLTSGVVIAYNRYGS